jgi:hypothetical protein
MQNAWDKIILSVSLFLLAVVALLLAFFFPTKEAIIGTNNPNPSGSKVARIDAKQTDALTQGWLQPSQWNESESKHKLFVSELFFYDKGEDKIFAADPQKTEIKGIPLWWLQKYNLDVKSATVDRDDPDGDGFTNFTEFKAETDPRDPNSHPSYLALLRLKSFDRIRFRIRFQTVNELNGEKVFQINLLDAKIKKSHLVKIGANLEGYVVTKYEEKIVKRYNERTKVEEEVNESALTIEKPEIGFKIDLIYNKDIDSPESTAHFIMLLPGKTENEIIVHRGEEFSIPQEPNVKYKLYSVDSDASGDKATATIHEVASPDKPEIKIPKVQNEDYDSMPAASRPTENRSN